MVPARRLLPTFFQAHADVLYVGHHLAPWRVSYRPTAPAGRGLLAMVLRRSRAGRGRGSRAAAARARRRASCSRAACSTGHQYTKVSTIPSNMTCPFLSCARRIGSGRAAARTSVGRGRAAAIGPADRPGPNDRRTDRSDFVGGVWGPKVRWAAGAHETEHYDRPVLLPGGDDTWNSLDDSRKPAVLACTPARRSLNRPG